jgi:hypothetical protein
LARANRKPGLIGTAYRAGWELLKRLADATDKALHLNGRMKRKSTTKPSPAQLAARKRFAEMARSGAFKKKATARKSSNPGKVRLSEREAAKYAGKIKGLSFGSAPRRRKTAKGSQKLSSSKQRLGGRKTKRGATKGLFRAFRVGRAVGRATKKTGRGIRAAARGTRRASAAGWRGLLRGLRNPLAHPPARSIIDSLESGEQPNPRYVKRLRALVPNPHGVHLPGLAPKYQRMYEDILAGKGYGKRTKEVAARTVEKAAHNPEKPTAEQVRWAKSIIQLAKEKGFKPGTVTEKSLGREFYRRWNEAQKILYYHYRGNPSKRQTRERKTVRARRQQIVYRRQHGAPKRGAFKWNGPIYNEFRGRAAKSIYKTTAANGTPADCKEAGGLEEITLAGGTIPFNRNRAKLLYKGQNLYVGGVQFPEKLPPRLANRRRRNPAGEIDLGEIKRIAYHADKPHLPERNSEKYQSYEHFFGEEGGRCPHLVLDAERRPRIEGGDYRISPDGIID